MSREWTERHIRELIDDELRDIKPAGMKFVRSDSVFQVPHYINNNMLEYMMINHLTMINYNGQIVGKALFSAPDGFEYSTYAFYSRNGARIFAIMSGNIGDNRPFFTLPEFTFRDPNDDPGGYTVLTPYVYDGFTRTREMFASPYAVMKTANGDKKFDLDVQWVSGELKNPDNSGTGWYTRLNYIVPYTARVAQGYSNWNEYNWGYRDPDAGTDPLVPGYMQGSSVQLSTHTIHFVYHYVTILKHPYSNEIWR